MVIVNKEYEEKQYIEIIGRGASFPKIFNEVTGQVDTNVGVSRINQSLKVILFTRLGERWGFPDFGSKLHNLVFSDNNEMVFGELAKIYVEDAINKWEKRIKLVSVTVGLKEHGNIVPIKINYIIRNSNIEGSYVYPYVVKPKDVIEV